MDDLDRGELEDQTFRSKKRDDGETSVNSELDSAWPADLQQSRWMSLGRGPLDDEWDDSEIGRRPAVQANRKEIRLLAENRLKPKNPKLLFLPCFRKLFPHFPWPQRSISRMSRFYANNRWRRRPGPRPGAEAVTPHEILPLCGFSDKYPDEPPAARAEWMIDRRNSMTTGFQIRWMIDWPRANLKAVRSEFSSQRPYRSTKRNYGEMTVNSGLAR